MRASLRPFTYAWRGFVSLEDEISKGNVVVEGPTEWVEAFPEWLLGSMLASEPRLRPGAEAEMQRTLRAR